MPPCQEAPRRPPCSSFLARAPGRQLPAARTAAARPDRARAGRGGRSSSPSWSTCSWDGGEGGGCGASNGLRSLIGAVHYGVPDRAGRGRGARRVRGRCCPRCGRSARAGCACSRRADARARGRDARPRPGRAAPCTGTPPGSSPRGGVVGEGLYWLLSSRTRVRRRAHRRRVPVPRGGAAAHRRLDRRRGQGDDELGLHDDPRHAGGRPAAPRRPSELAAMEVGEPRVSRRVVEPEPVPEPEPLWPDDPPTEVIEPDPEPEPVEEPRLAEDPETDEPGVTRAPVGPRAAHAAGPLPRRGHRLARLRVGGCPTPASSSAPPRRPRGPTRPARRRSPRS